ncbi:MAG: hypothetical protein R2750_05055 [Bacteroidales bacterium]
MVYPQIWQDEKIIKVANDQLQDFLGCDKMARFNQIVDMQTAGDIRLVNLLNGPMQRNHQ